MTQPNQTKQYDFTLAEVNKLFQMQDTLNSYIHPKWKTQGFNWGLAIVDECMEIHGHLGWKWWKKDYQIGLTEANRKQVQLEVIDILHFVISHDIDVDYASNLPNCIACFNSGDYPQDIEEAVTGLRRVESTGMYGEFLERWAGLAHSVGLTKSQILETYTQKYALNKFRQDHGYKTGEYCKEWVVPAPDLPKGHGTSGEDNEWLEAVVTKLRQGNHDTTDENLLYSELASLYNSRFNK